MNITKINFLLRNLFESMHCIQEEIGDENWITVGGHPILIGPKIKVKKLKRKEPTGKLVTRKRKDGSEYQKRIYPKWWTDHQTKVKFSIMQKLASEIDSIEDALDDDLELDGKGFKKVAAIALKLMITTGMRVGDGSKGAGKTDGKDTYGATTLQKRHVRVSGDTVKLDYPGKDGIDRHVSVENELLANGIRDLLGKDSLPDDDDPLFVFDGNDPKHPTKTKKTRLRRKQATSRLKDFGDYKPKDLRTLRANETASDKVLDIINEHLEIPEKNKDRKKFIKNIISQIAEYVAKDLGNTPNVAKGSYVNPALIEIALKEIGLR